MYRGDRMMTFQPFLRFWKIATFLTRFYSLEELFQPFLRFWV